MTGADRLARHYRRLLWAYPRRYRRERGAELVTTLLDDATPGQLRPTVAEARDLVAGGLRARLRPPRHPFARLVAAQVALYAGVLGAAAGVLLSGYPGPPDGAAAVAAATIAVPERPLAWPGPPVACDNSGVARLGERRRASASSFSMTPRSRPVSWPMPSTTISGV